MAHQTSDLLSETVVTPAPILVVQGVSIPVMIPFLAQESPTLPHGYPGVATTGIQNQPDITISTLTIPTVTSF